jgi:MarR family transcriptional regulator, organic hydroperoxide resistance regulator
VTHRHSEAPVRTATVGRGARAATEDPTVAEVVDSLRAIIRELRRGGREAEQAGVHGAQLFAMQKLAEGPAASLGELARRTYTDPSSVSVVVTRLVERGLVTRTVDADDRRRVLIALTTAGRAVVRRAPRAAQARLLSAAQQLPERQIQNLASGLRALVRGLEAQDGDEEG